ncbi:MAG: flagellar hook-length control protein FliK, partial [Bordetella sp.]|nr:flagellar hook-length control protein FliK [Bordetella sp.]
PAAPQPELPAAAQPVGTEEPVLQHTPNAPAAHVADLANALQAAVQQQSQAVAARPAVAAPVVTDPMAVSMSVNTPVGATQWGQDLGRQMMTLSQAAQRGPQTADLRLDPPDLGPLRVTISLSDGIASASFVSAHAAVRNAVESALPQLQQALAQAGISLGQTSVSDQGSQQAFDTQGQGQRQRQGGQQDGAAGSDAGAATVEVALPTRNSNALVDTFA